MTSAACACVRPLSIARLRWAGSCATWPVAIRALTVTRLRSRGARSGRSHRSRNSTSVVFWTMARNDGAELLADAPLALRLPGLVDRKRRRRSIRELIRPDLARGKDLVCDRDRRHGIRPARIEREMGDDLGDLARLDAVVEREVQMARHLDRLVAGDQRRERDDAAVPRREPRAFPEVAEQRPRAYFSSAGATVCTCSSVGEPGAAFVWSACADAEAISESDANVAARRFNSTSCRSDPPTPASPLRARLFPEHERRDAGRAIAGR